MTTKSLWVVILTLALIPPVMAAGSSSTSRPPAAPRPSLNNLIYTGMYATYMLIGGYYEEQRLVKIFGDDYRRYRAQVGAFFPRLWRLVAA